jgi:hypothetical protein
MATAIDSVVTAEPAVDNADTLKAAKKAELTANYAKFRLEMDAAHAVRMDRTAVPVELAKAADKIADKLRTQATPLFGADFALELAAFERERHVSEFFGHNGWQSPDYFVYRPYVSTAFMARALERAKELRLDTLKQLTVPRLYAIAEGLRALSKYDNFGRSAAHARATLKACTFVESFDIKAYEAKAHTEAAEYDHQQYHLVYLAAERLKRDIFWMAYFCYYPGYSTGVPPPAVEMGSVDLLGLVLTDGLPPAEVSKSDLIKPHAWAPMPTCNWHDLKALLPQAEYGEEAKFRPCRHVDFIRRTVLGCDAVEIDKDFCSEVQFYGLDLCAEHSAKVKALKAAHAEKSAAAAAAQTAAEIDSTTDAASEKTGCKRPADSDEPQSKRIAGAAVLPDEQ